MGTIQQHLIAGVTGLFFSAGWPGAFLPRNNPAGGHIGPSFPEFGNVLPIRSIDGLSAFMNNRSWFSSHEQLMEDQLPVGKIHRVPSGLCSLSMFFLLFYSTSSAYPPPPTEEANPFSALSA